MLLQSEKQCQVWEDAYAAAQTELHNTKNKLMAAEEAKDALLQYLINSTVSVHL